MLGGVFLVHFAIRLGALAETEEHFVDLDVVAPVQTLSVRDAGTVDESAVQAAEVLEEEPLRVVNDASVAARDGGQGQDKVAMRFAADDGFRVGKNEALAGVGSLQNFDSCISVVGNHAETRRQSNSICAVAPLLF